MTIAVHPFAAKLAAMNRHTRTLLGRASLAILCSAALFTCGCGVGGPAEFAGRLIGAGGELIVAEDVDAIVQDFNLTDNEKRAALRDLGIEDEKLIDALLTL